MNMKINIETLDMWQNVFIKPVFSILFKLKKSEEK